MDRMLSILSRQSLNDNPNDTTSVNNDVPFWWTQTGQIVRWVIFLGILAIVFGFLAVSYCHARRRMNKGLAPLPYHRWLVNRNRRARYDPTYQDPAANYYPYNGGGYNMHPMPPPIYDPSAPMPPIYQAPEGASKVDPSQWTTVPTTRPAAAGELSPSYEAPVGPPPGASVQKNHTGTSSASNNPYRM